MKFNDEGLSLFLSEVCSMIRNFSLISFAGLLISAVLVLNVNIAAAQEGGELSDFPEVEGLVDTRLVGPEATGPSTNVERLPFKQCYDVYTHYGFWQVLELVFAKPHTASDEVLRILEEVVMNACGIMKEVLDDSNDSIGELWVSPCQEMCAVVNNALGIEDCILEDVFVNNMCHSGPDGNYSGEYYNYYGKGFNLNTMIVCECDKRQEPYHEPIDPCDPMSGYRGTGVCQAASTSSQSAKECCVAMSAGVILTTELGQSSSLAGAASSFYSS
jgi:hypothetical protein